MSPIPLLFIALFAGFERIHGAPRQQTPDGDLFLTPLIKAGKIQEAKDLAADHMKEFHIASTITYDLVSYSGYLTVDEKHNSNVFFWFFPAEKNPENSSVILWTNEAVGFSCLQAIFLENGPFYLDKRLRLHERKHSWTKTHSMLYIDVPVGTGFSFTDDEEGYISTNQEEADELHDALQQFFTLFHEYKKNDFFIAGEIVAVEHIPQMIDKIDMENEKNPSDKINLKGVMFGSPFFNIKKQTKFGKFFHDMNLIEDDHLEKFTEREAQLMDLLDKKEYEEAHKVAASLVVFPNSLYETSTGLASPFNILHDKPPEELKWFEKFVNSKQIHNFLHVGFHNFSVVNWKVYKKFTDSTMSFDPQIFAKLLDKNYPVLVYSNQFDAVAYHAGVTESLEGLDWSGKQEFADADRSIWRVNGQVAGYVRKAKNLTYVMVRLSGRYLMMDKPEWGFAMIETFTGGKEF